MHAICAKITQKLYAVTITIGFYTKGKLACEVWLHQQQLGRLSNSKHRWATPPHYHHKHTVSISTSEQATSRKHKEPFTQPQSAPDSRHGCHNAKPRTQRIAPTHDNNTTTMCKNPVSDASLQCAIRIRQPKHLHVLVWERTTPDDNQSSATAVPHRSDVKPT